MAKNIEIISLQDIIPSSIADDKNVEAIITATDPQLKEVSQSIREAFIISRINELPETVIDLLAWQWHVDFYEPELPIQTKRQLVLESIKWHRKKGTKTAIKSALEKLGFVPTIKEWFEPEMGTAPHTFSVSGYYKDDHIDVDFLGEQTKEILTRVIEVTKPVRSHLLHLTIAPIPIDMSKHICIWDVCNWEHVERKKYEWGEILTPDNPIFSDILTSQYFEGGIHTVVDSPYWDFAKWGGIPIRRIQVGETSEIGIFASFEWGEGENAILNPNFWDYARWGYSTTFSRSFGFATENGIFASLDWEKIPLPILEIIPIIGVVCDMRPHWDDKTWLEHDTWTEEIEQIPIYARTHTDIEASLDWISKREDRNTYWDLSRWDFQEREKYNAPLPKWSEFKTWEGSNTWDTTTAQCATWESGTWEFQEVA